MSKPGILCVGNWDSNVGYAWWLMESFWIKIAERYSSIYNVYLVYPTISKIPNHIASSQLIIKKYAFGNNGSLIELIKQLLFIRKNNIKYIYYSDRPFFAFRYAWFRVAGVRKIIVHDHTPGLRTKPKGFKKWLKTMKSRIPWFNCDVAIGATDFVKNRCIDVNCFPPERCFSAPNGIPLDVYTNGASDILGNLNIPSDKTVIVSVGRVSMYKGIDFALKVIHELVLRGLNVHFLYLGDGPDMEACKQIINDMKIEQNVTLAGRVDNVHSILTECDIAFHPSHGEVGYSLAILEYMRAGLPVVVPDNPSVCAATDNMQTGVLYREGDDCSAAESISMLVNKRDVRESMGDNAYLKLCDKFSLKRCHDKFYEIIDSVIPINDTI